MKQAHEDSCSFDVQEVLMCERDEGHEDGPSSITWLAQNGKYWKTSLGSLM